MLNSTAVGNEACVVKAVGVGWIEAFDAKDRTANIRVKEAIELGVDVIALPVPLPLCLKMQ
jgi:hypothetical protein